MSNYLLVFLRLFGVSCGNMGIVGKVKTCIGGLMHLGYNKGNNHPHRNDCFLIGNYFLFNRNLFYHMLLTERFKS